MTAFATLSSNSRLHLRHDADLRDAPVSPSSKWGDARWFFDNPVPGAPSSASMLSWDLILPDGRNLLDEHHNNLLDWLRRLAWSLFASPGNNAQPLSPGSASTTSTGLRYLASWLVQNSYDKPDQLDPAALASYRDDLAYSLAEDSDGDDLSQAQANLRLRPIIALWQQRGELSAAGIAPMPQIPWGGRGAIEMAREVTARADGYTMPLPDEIAIPVLNRAADFLGQPTDDVLRLQAQCDAIDDREPTDHHTGPGTSEVYKKELRGEALKAFIFSRNPQTGEPWHDRLEIITNERGELIYPAQRFRQLLLAVRNAAAITIQAGTGMRISEICGLPAGIDDQSGLPRCVRVVPSFTGLNEIFLIRTVISKMEDTPREVDWLAGMRPKGASDLPLPVRAIIILDQLLVRYRQMLRSDRLLVQFTNLRGLPVRSASVAQIRSMSLLKGMRDFVEEWVDFTSLPDKSEHAAEDNDLVPYKNTNGRCIRSHQFRKFYANFALSVDPRLLPAVQMHFHHISQAMTEGHYWGTNLLQIEPLSTTQRQHTALLLYELATGKTLVSGRMGDQLQASIEELRIKIGVRGGGEGWRNAISLVFEYDIRLWFAPHGKCLPLVPQAMRCHQLAGTSSWLNKEPNYETREPGVCAGCASFVIDSKHRTFWEDRFLANMTAFRAAVRAGNGDTFRVIAIELPKPVRYLLRLALTSVRWKHASIWRRWMAENRRRAEIETDFLMAIERLVSGRPTHPALKKRKEETGRLAINISNVALEAGRSRTLIATRDTTYPTVKHRLMELAKPHASRGTATTIIDLRAELSETRKQLKMALAEAAGHFHARVNAERDAARWRQAYERLSSKRGDESNIVLLKSPPAQ